MAVAVGGTFTLVVNEKAQVYACGTNRVGQLGIGTADETDQFELIENKVDHTPGFNGEHVVMVAAGRRHSACVTEEGSVWTWGNCHNGRLGTIGFFDGYQHRFRPDRLNRDFFGRSRARMVACGERFTMVLTVDGRVWNCGDNECGQLGHDDCDDRMVLTRMDPIHFGASPVTMIAAAWNHSLAQVAGSGALYTWGSNIVGQLGHSAAEGVVKLPTALPAATFGGLGVASFAGGCEYSMVVTVAGLVYGAGWNQNGQLGIGNYTSSATFQLVGEANVNNFQTEGIRTVSCGMWHTLFVSNNGILWGCGTGNYTRDPFGDPNAPVDNVYPVPIYTDDSDREFKVVAAGMQHSAAITCSGQLYVWGINVCVTVNCNIVGPPDYHNYRDVFPTPQHMHPKTFAYTRLGRWHGMNAERAIAFMMSSHKMLGCISIVKNLDDDLLRMIIEQARFQPRADTGNALRTLIGFCNLHPPSL